MIDRPLEPTQERNLKVYQIIFILWGIVFIYWMARQFSEYNKRKDRK